MWILPNNLKSYPSALDHLESSEELLDLEQELAPSFTWRGKLLPVSTWRSKWKRVWWMPRLFGRMLKPSTHDRFATEYTASLAVIPAREKAAPAGENWNDTKDSFGRLFASKYGTATLFSVSSRTSTPTSAGPSPTFLKTYDQWVITLRQASTRRLNVALRTGVAVSSSLRGPTLENCGDAWPTPVANRGTYQRSSDGVLRLQLPKAVQHWPTPVAADWRGAGSAEFVKERMKRKGGPTLVEAVNRLRYYPTPLASENEKGAYNTGQKSLTTMVANGQLLPGSPSNGTKKLVSREVQRLNPAWVAQLMGTTLERTFFGCMETEWLSRRQKLRGEILPEKLSPATEAA